MRWVYIAIAAIVVLPILWKLLLFATKLAFGLVHIALILAVILFVVGLVRRMLVAR